MIACDEEFMGFRGGGGGRRAKSMQVDEFLNALLVFCCCQLEEEGR